MGDVKLFAKLDCVTKKMFIHFNRRDYEFFIFGDNDTVGKGAISARGIYEWVFSWKERDSLPTFTLYKMIPTDDRFEDVHFTPDINNPIGIPVEIVNGSKEDYFGVTFHNGFLSWVDVYGEMVHEISKYQIVCAMSKTMGQEKLTLAYSEIKNWAFEFEMLNKGREWDDEWIDEVAAFVENKLNKLKI